MKTQKVETLKQKSQEKEGQKNKVPHVSFSELKNWQRCPFYHKLTRIDKIKSFEGNEYTAFGTAIHEVFEKKLLNEETNSEEHFTNVFEEELKKLAEKNITADPDLVAKMNPQGKKILPEVSPAMLAFFDDFGRILPNFLFKS